MQIVSNGTNWETGDKKTMRGYAENYPANDTRPIASATRSTAIGVNGAGAGSQAVTGTGAMALGGSYASGTDSFAAAIANNTSTYGAQGPNSVAIGRFCLASGSQSFASGNVSLATGGAAFNLGQSGTASGNFSFVSGLSGKAAEYGKWARANGKFLADGDAQGGLLIVRRATTDATASVLSSTGAAGNATNQVTLSNNSAFSFTGTVVARQKAADGTASAAWKVEGLIRREGTAASTTLVASTVTAIDNTPGWTLALSADTTNGCLAITATGAAATNIQWVATIQTSEVVYA
jgi:hypothetical protein